MMMVMMGSCVFIQKLWKGGHILIFLALATYTKALIGWVFVSGSLHQTWGHEIMYEVYMGVGDRTRWPI